MRPEEFTSFEDAMPAKNKHIIITNNIDATDAHGEMSHVWMTRLVLDSEKPGEGLIAFTDRGYNKVQCLTHWKYA